MTVYRKVIKVQSHGGRPTYTNITDEVRKAIEESGVQTGICAVISPHTTCSVFFEEFCHDINEDGDEYLQQDLNEVLEKIIPNQDSLDTYHYPGEAHYKAVEAWPNAADYLPNGDRSALWNGDAHLKSTLLGSSETFDVTEGKLGVGSTGYVYFADFDRSRPRGRRCIITVLGE
ncbi:YjbQ family protein [Catenisphaera adipataccumulans]|jgi:thiamine phosphate synthase YjbQ (UPF0047 family)|uniref:Thiamine phosphate synthase YjbQ (UPF0047 family) n=1 Tax=Catenisphaera adipataccumulans TaxID=700500 RepID=A0A7W8FWW6_9FIRM|nr:YjbQ family protein [Catenisphaera adipataccumulans]MBB5183040.1 thiamine phosphate synthase YjbQ (UPF0047 family) [Catenisphaera adipataccumulans]